jgi:hypothetical protein
VGLLQKRGHLLIENFGDGVVKLSRFYFQEAVKDELQKEYLEIFQEFSDDCVFCTDKGSVMVHLVNFLIIFIFINCCKYLQF